MFAPTATPSASATPNVEEAVTLTAQALASQPPAPTLDVTPTLITATPGGEDLGIIEAPTLTPNPLEPPIAGPDTDATLTTPTPFPTVVLGTVPATLAAPPVLAPPTFVPINPAPRQFIIGPGGTVTGIDLLGNPAVTITLFERNPIYTDEWVSTDTSGNLYVSGLNGADAYRPDSSPFSAFFAQSRAENNTFVSEVSWSPNGEYLAFIAESQPGGAMANNDGVWIGRRTAPNRIGDFRHLMVDCPERGVYSSCNIVNAPAGPNTWKSLDLLWSPGSDAILVSSYFPSEGRRGLTVLTLNEDYRTRPRPLLYEFGAWEARGSRVLVSGRGEDGSNYVAWILRDGSFSELVFGAETQGYWMGWAVQRSDGRILALGAPGDRNGPYEPLRIYDITNGTAQQASNPVAINGLPNRAEWNPGRSAAVLFYGGQRIVLTLNGGGQDVTQETQGGAVNFAPGEPPPGQPIVPANAAPIPSGVIAGNRFGPGEQLVVYSIELNMRTGPGVAYPYARRFLINGETIAVLAGPYSADGYEWWQVQTWDNIVGWVAAIIEGRQVIGPALN